MTTITLNGLRYAIRKHESENQNATPLLLLHGFTGSSRDWTGLMVDMTRPTLAPDLIGHGESAAPSDPQRYAMAQAAADVSALIEAQCGPPVHLLGYSMGGRLALCVALSYPTLVRSLILESASPGLATEEERSRRRSADEGLASSIETDGVAAFVMRWEQLPLFASQQALPKAVQAGLRSHRLTNRPDGLANSLRGMGTGVQPSLWPVLADVKAPTLLIAGGLDQKFQRINRLMAQQIPDARLQIVPDAGHNVHLEKPAHFRTQISKFLDQIEEESDCQAA